MNQSDRKKALLAKFPRQMGARINKITCSGRHSLRAAVDLFCVECMGCQNGHASMIRECTAEICPLFTLRPFQGGE